MIDTLVNWDKQLFSLINSLHADWLDSIMLFLSYNYVFMLVIVLALFALVIKKYKKQAFKLFAILVIIFGLSDSISTRIFKDNIKRYRPCHDAQFSGKVHLAGKKCWGGKYGFVSSHASNSFAVMTFFILLLAKYYPAIWLMYGYSFLVGYSRIYLAKHYPLDIICGAILGILISIAVLKLLKKFKPLH